MERKRGRVGVVSWRQLRATGTCVRWKHFSDSSSPYERVIRNQRIRRRCEIVMGKLTRGVISDRFDHSMSTVFRDLGAKSSPYSSLTQHLCDGNRSEK